MTVIVLCRAGAEHGCCVVVWPWVLGMAVGVVLRERGRCGPVCCAPLRVVVEVVLRSIGLLDALVGVCSYFQLFSL